MSLLKSVAAVGGLTIVSRVAGFVRDLAMASLFGAGAEADAFFTAMRLPDLARRLFAEGALATAFVPRFAAIMVEGGRAAAFDFAGRVLTGLLVASAALILVAEPLMPWLVALIAPGVSGAAADLVVDFARLTFPYVLPVSVVALLGGVLNGLGRVAAFAAAPILFNLTLLAALWGGGASGGASGFTLAAAVPVAGLVQMVWMFLALRLAGGRLRPIAVTIHPRLDPEVRALFARVGPGALATGAGQINLTVDVVLASLLPAGAVSALSYADRLAQLPLGIVGLSVGMAVLPRLSAISAADRAARDRGAAEEPEDSGVTFRQGVLAALALILPAAVGLGVAAGPIVDALFLRGAFDAEDAAATSGVLAAYAAGLPAAALIKPVNAAYFARGDTVTPMRAALVVAAVNVALSLTLLPALGVVGIALATSVAAWLNLPLLPLLPRLGRGSGAIPSLAGLGRPVAALGVATLLMGIATHALIGVAPRGVFGLALIVAGAVAVYGAALAVLGLVFGVGRRRRGHAS